MKKVTIELNKDVKSLLVKAINSETKLLELSHNIIAIMNVSKINDLEIIKATIKNVQKLKASKSSTLPAKLITICNKLINGSVLPEKFETMTIEGIKSSFISEPKSVSAKSKKVAKGTSTNETEVNEDETEVNEDEKSTCKTMDKDDLISNDITLFSKIKLISANKFDTKISTFNVEQLRTIEIALNLINNA